jgi:serine/threonine-protein kinase PknG
MTAIACVQPGCGGVIEDGYCSSCGMAPAAVPPASAGPSGATIPPRGAAPWASTGPAAGTGPATTPGGFASGPAGYGQTASSGQSAGSRSGPRSGSVSGGASVTGSGPSGSRRGSRSSSGRRSSRGGLGAGLVEVPPVPARDPSTAVLANPQVPENRRYCGNCDQPVGRGRDGRPGLAEGFCRNCGTPFSFRPKLEPGELVAGQYEVLGCLAHGGLGWIYLAKDRNVSDRWVVLKGLLNTGDADAMAAAVAERQFLAEVEHPNIVRIYNFVQHADQRTGEPSGYIVMEYVGGKSLKQILQDWRGNPDPARRSVPLEHALAFAIEVLPALGYLHDRGLVYCDFKPDNVIQTEEQLKLIDMGGVRRIDSDDPIYGTAGYQAPEIADDGPSPESDLYTVGRALAVLTFEFKGYQGEFKYKLPDGVPILAQHESFRRLLARATHTDPARRFASAGEMRDQLTGVLREVLAAGDGKARPTFSRVFSPELRAVGTDGAPQPPAAAQVITALPVPQVDGADPAAGFLATMASQDPAQRVAALASALASDGTVPRPVAESPETRLALARAQIDVGDLGGAGAVLAELAVSDPGDWRVAWYNGLRELASGRASVAAGAFSLAYDELPGELAPKLALALAAEAAGDLATADRYYRVVWICDRSYVSAAFGLARTRLAAGDRSGAIEALTSVPDTSSYHVAAQTAAVRMLVSGTGGASEDELRGAADRLSRLALDDASRQRLTVEILRAALDWTTGTAGNGGSASGGAAGGGAVGVRGGSPGGGAHVAGGSGQALAPRPSGSAPILGCQLTERSIRFGLESSYRALARLTSDDARRIQLVDMANSVRPRTWT